MSLYRSLGDIGLEDLSEYGGKAARLGEAIRLGCPVLPGVALSTELYRRFMRQGGLQGEIASILSTMQPSAVPHFLAAEWAIREAFRVRRVPDEVLEVIREARATLGSPSIVVRSSATHEHGPRHTFVGQHESYLGVTGEEATIEAVVGCWTSLFSAKALAYAYRFGIDLLGSAMAVLFQPMIIPATKGMLFTVDPITGNPDTFVLEIQEGAHKGTFYLDPYGEGPDEPVLGTELKRLGLLLDEHTLLFQAIEWAVVDDRLYLLRVFPVTKAPPYLPASARDVGTIRGPLELVRSPGSSPRAMRPYSWYHRSRSQRLNAAYMRKAHRLFLPYLERDEFFLCGYLYARWRRLTSAEMGEIAGLGRLLLNLRRLVAARTLDREFRALWREKRPRLDVLNEGVDLSVLSKQELARYLEEVMAIGEAFYSQSGRLGDSYELIPRILLDLHRHWLGSDDDFWALLGAEHDQLYRRDEELCQLAQTDYPNESESEAAFRRFFRRYRHLYLQGNPLVEKQDICLWREDDLAARGAFCTCRQDKGRALQDQMTKRRVYLQEAERRVWRRLGRGRRFVYRYVLGLARRYASLRADRDEPVLLSLLLERDVVREVGRRLCAQGVAEIPEDASLLGCRELLDYLEDKMAPERVMHLLQERRELYRRWWRYAPPEILSEEPLPSDFGRDLSEEDEDLFRGLAVSPGSAEGRVRVVNALSEATSLLPGEVLVCHEPLFELSPLFGVAAAVVAETGTLLSHSAILVREYGVPAVFGVKGATELLRNGEEVLVDGSKGFVARRLIEPELELL